MKKIEILDKRKKREKHYLQEDGTFIAELYDDDVHFFNNEKYEEIDNTLELKNDYYTNKANDFKVYFSNKRDSEIMKLEQNGNYIITSLKNYKDYSIEKKKNTSILYDNIKYVEVLKNIDISYDITPSKVKENIIIKNTDADIDNLIFEIKTDLDLELNDNEIVAKKNNQKLFSIENPYMIDATGDICKNVHYSLAKKDSFYELNLSVDYAWINKSKFPIIIDPTISQYSNENSVIDTYIYEGDTGITKSNLEYFKVGVERNNNVDIKNRALLWFQLPELGTGSQVISANLLLRGYPDTPNNYNYTYLDIHKVNQEWMNTEPNWVNMNDKYDSRVEGNMEARRTYFITDNTISYCMCAGDITSLVQKWYTNEPNYGILIKSSNEVYNSSLLPQFFSKENNVNGGSPKPLLLITYRILNGIEEYMGLESHEISIGKIYHNLFNGNLISLFEIGKTSNIHLNLVYNTNDVVLNKNIGYGLGFRLNFSQTIEEEYVDNTKYLKYINDTGAVHYFLNKKNKIVNNNIVEENYVNKYCDEDGLNLTITDFDTYYILTDNNGVENRFDIINNIGYLTQIKNKASDVINISYDNNNRIISIIDSNNEQMSISYNNNIISITSPTIIYSLTYNNDFNLTKINVLNKEINILNTNNLITEITDVNNKKICYEYYNKNPYRIKKISQYGNNNDLGRYYLSNYNHFSTTLTDFKGRKKNILFNSQGNPISVTGLDENIDLKTGYGSKFDFKDSDITLNNFTNKNLSSYTPIKYVKNLLTNSSFEQNNIIFLNENVSCSISDDFANSGFTSLKCESTDTDSFIYLIKELPVNKNYTFSGYFKPINESVTMSIYSTDENDNFILNEEVIIPTSDDFERYDVSTFLSSDSTGKIKIIISISDSEICYIDNIQLEEGMVANEYNFIDNSDFSDGLDSSWQVTSSNYPPNNIVSIASITPNQNALKVKMYSSNTTEISKTFEISGKQGDLLTLSFWYKNEGLVSAKYWDEILVPHNGVSLRFHPIENIQSDAYIFQEPLNNNENEWQFFIYNFYAPFDYDNFKLLFYQSQNANDLYITNINLFKDIRNIRNEFDESSNIKTKIHLNNKTSNYSYDNNNELVCVNKPNNKNFIYEYDNDNPKKILSTISEDGVINEIEYSNNKPTVSRTIDKGIMFTPNQGAFKIRLKGTNKNIGIHGDSILISNEKHSHYTWNLNSININDITYYTFSHSIINNKYFRCDSSNQLVLSNYSGDENLFILEKQSNGSFYIKNKASNLYLKISDNCLIFDSINDNNSDYEFYFESNFNSKFLENNTYYSLDGINIEKTIDSDLHSLNYTFDQNTGLINSVTNAIGNVTNYEYNTNRQLIKLKNNDREVLYNYGSNNKISKITQGEREYNITYDNYDNLKKILIGNNIELIDNIYETNNGNLIQKKYGNNQSRYFEYDRFDRVTKITNEDSIFKYYYNNISNIGKIVSDFGVQKFRYDLSRNIIEYKNGDFSIKYKYNDNNDVIEKKFKIDNLEYLIENTYDDELIQKQKFNNVELNYIYDEIDRITDKNIGNNISNNYTYLDNGKRASLQVKKIINNLKTIEYKYNKLNNVTHIYDNNVLVNKYYYDEYHQLIKEDDYNRGLTIRYKYDEYGNIISKSTYKIGTYDVINIDKYSYNNSSWLDQLTKYNNNSIVYDDIGNPTIIGNDELTWINGRQLSQYIKGNNTISFKYDESGFRLSKSINNNEIKYYLENKKLVLEKGNNYVLYYMRDTEDNIIGFVYNSIVYFYIKNKFNDVIAIIDLQGNVIAKYYYDSWGNTYKITDGNNVDITNNSNHIGIINPIRFRSYYYDKETELYYLNDRYYNPKWGRFLNADGVIMTCTPIIGNLYSYCNNDPINNIDPSGQSILKKLVNAYNKIKSKIKTVIKACSDFVSPILKNASKALNRSLNDRPGNICYGPTDNTVVNAVKNSNTFKSTISNAIANKQYGTSSSAAPDIALRFPVKELDLHLAYGKTTLNIYEKEPNSNIYSVKITDRYNFEYWDPNGPLTKNNELYKFIVYMNDAAYFLQFFGVINNYDYSIQFDYKYDKGE